VSCAFPGRSLTSVWSVRITELCTSFIMNDLASVLWSQTPATWPLGISRLGSGSRRAQIGAKPGAPRGPSDAVDFNDKPGRSWL
jgi:hypothetical protein